MIHFLQAMWSWAAGGFVLLPHIFINMRWQICANCEVKKEGMLRTYCDACKCTISRKRHPLQKLAHPCEGCPLGKWGPVHGFNCDEGIQE